MKTVNNHGAKRESSLYLYLREWLVHKNISLKKTIKNLKEIKNKKPLENPTRWEHAMSLWLVVKRLKEGNVQSVARDRPTKQDVGQWFNIHTKSWESQHKMHSNKFAIV